MMQNQYLRIFKFYLHGVSIVDALWHMSVAHDILSILHWRISNINIIQ